MENQEEILTKKERKELRRQNNETEKERHQKNRNFKKFLIFGFIVFILWFGIYFLTKINKKYQGINSQVNSVTAQDHTRGNKNAKNIFIEYSDFQCPACKAYKPILEQISADLNDNMLFVYRNFPLRGIHQNSQLAAQVAEAAALQGKFWEMHDLLFEKQDEWAEQKDPSALFASYVQLLGLNIEQFKNDLNSDAVKQKIETDYNGAVTLKINATPTFYLNGKELGYPKTFDEFSANVKSIVEQNK